MTDSANGPRFLDGNAAAGALQQLFTFDVTTARGSCLHCGAVPLLAEARMYAEAPGLVLRCPGCDGVLLRLVVGPGRYWLDLRGVALLEVTDAP